MKDESTGAFYFFILIYNFPVLEDDADTKTRIIEDDRDTKYYVRSTINMLTLTVTLKNIEDLVFESSKAKHKLTFHSRKSQDSTHVKTLIPCSRATDVSAAS